MSPATARAPGHPRPTSPTWRPIVDPGVLVIALALVAFELSVGLCGDYGIFIDEFYYVACARHLDWGYVDHPPLAPLLLRAALAIFGDAQWALRVPPALAGGATVCLAGHLAARLGGNRISQRAAALATATAPTLLVIFGLFGVNALEILVWSLVCTLWLEAVIRPSPKIWALVGLAIGIGFLNKHTIVSLGIALAVGLVATPMRRQLRGMGPWVGVLVALLVAVPNLVWQNLHDWPSLEFYRNAALHKNLAIPPHEVLRQQLMAMGMGTMPVGLAGWMFLARAQAGRWRSLAWAYAALLGLLIASEQSRPDRIAGMYPLVFAAGATYLTGRWPSRWFHRAVFAWLAVMGLAIVPLASPSLPPASQAKLFQQTGLAIQSEAGPGKTSPLPQWLADRLGWPALHADVRAALAKVPTEQREGLVLLAPSYGQAGALELLGAQGLPPVYADHNTYHSWGPPPESTRHVLVLGRGRGQLETLFADVEQLGVHDCGELCMRWRDDMPIWLASNPRRSWPQIWQLLRHYE